VTKPIETRDDANKLTSGDKYVTEAASVEGLLKEGDIKAASERLRIDGHLAPHELHKFMADLKNDAKKDLPNVTITDDQSKGIKVEVTSPHAREAKTVFEVKADELAKATDKIPLTGQLLGLSKEKTDAILAIQNAEKAKLTKDQVATGQGFHRFGDIAVSLGYSTPDAVNKALDAQDHMRAKQSAEDMSHSLPVQAGEGYYDMIRRSRGIDNHTAAHLAHVVKANEHGKSVLNIGDQLRVLTPAQEAALEEQLYEKNRKITGRVQAQPG
jgi:hypothetical protein